MSSAIRVAERWLDGKGKQKAFLADYQRAMQALKAGDDLPLAEFAFATAKFILPEEGDWPDWMNALGTAKRNAIQKLYKEFRALLQGRHRMLNDPKVPREHALKWLEFYATPLAKAIRTLEIVSAVGDADIEVKHGPFTVIPMPGVTGKLAKTALDAVDVAIAKVKPRCPQVLYGKLFVTTTMRKGVAAEYLRSNDSVYLNVLAKKRFSDIFTVIHELGHRHDAKFLSASGRTEYWELSTRTVNPLHVSPYGATQPHENYAEGFAHFILGMDMPAELQSLLAEEVK